MSSDEIITKIIFKNWIKNDSHKYYLNLVTVPGDDTRCNGDRFDEVDDDSKKMISKK